MFKNLYFGLVALAMLLTSCKQSNCQQAASDVISFSVDVARNDSIADFISKEYQAIPLETNNSILIGNVDKILFADDKIFILDKRRNKGVVFVFNIKGFFLTKIDHIGQGSGEYPTLEDFDVNEGRIYLLSRGAKKIFVYSYDNKYQKEVAVNEWYDFLYVLNEHEVLLYSNFSNETKQNLVRFDYEKKRIVQSELPFERYEGFSFSQTPFNIVSSDNILLTQPYDYRIYSYKDGLLRTQYQLAFNTKSQLPKNVTEIPFATLYETLRGKSLITRINHITEKNSILYLSFVLDFYTNLVRIDQQTHEIKRVELVFFDDYPFAYHPPVAFVNGQYISVINADEVLGVNKGAFPSDKHEDGQLMEDDNPVIFIRDLK